MPGSAIPGRNWVPVPPLILTCSTMLITLKSVFSEQLFAMSVIRYFQDIGKHSQQSAFWWSAYRASMWCTNGGDELIREVVTWWCQCAVDLVCRDGKFLRPFSILVFNAPANRQPVQLFQQRKTLCTAGLIDQVSMFTAVCCSTVFIISAYGKHVADIDGRRCLRSANTSTLLVPSTRRSTVGDRAFPVAAACAWNALPVTVRGASTLSAFCRQLKTHLYRCTFD